MTERSARQDRLRRRAVGAPGSFALVLCGMLVLGGCSVMHDYELNLGDGGMDADVGPPMDAPPDVPKDVPDDAPPMEGGTDAGFETQCANGRDDDGDGLVDCADDFDCAGAPACCAGGESLFDETWQGDVTSRWKVSQPREGDAPNFDDGEIVSFADGAPATLIRRACTPMALGLELHADMRYMGRSRCEASECYATLALTFLDPASVGPGDALPKDLAVTLHAGGVLEVRRDLGGGQHETLGTASELPIWRGEQVRTEVRVTPGVDDQGELRLFVTVRAHNLDRDEETTVIDRVPIWTRDLLLDDDGACQRVPGLFVGIEGQGNDARIGRVTAKEGQCFNASTFSATVEDGTLQTLPADWLQFGPWADGGVGDPALASTCPGTDPRCWTSGGAVRWDLLVDATDADMQIGEYTHIRYRMGQATNVVGWSSQGSWLSTTAPKAGCHMPDADAGVDPCSEAPSIREPSLVALPHEDGTLKDRDLRVAFAREWEQALPDERDVFALHATTMKRMRGTRLDPGDPVLTPADDDECDSLRDPELVPATRDGAAFWLLYACMQGQTSSAIRAVRLDATLARTGADPITVLSADDLQKDLRGTIRSPEVVVDHEASPPWVRLWAMATSSAGGAWKIALARGQPPPESSLPETFPSLKPYLANPLLEADDPALGGCPDTHTCELLGFDVVERGDSPPRSSQTPRTLRFLVARRVNDGSGVAHELVPVEQRWRTP